MTIEDAALEPEDNVTIENNEVIESKAPAEPATAPVDDSYVEVDSERLQARFDKMTADKYAERRRADGLQAKLDVMLESAEVKVEPKLEDFDYDEQLYSNALIDFKVNKKADEIRVQQEAQIRQSSEKVNSDKLFSDYEVKALEFEKTHKDYQASISQLPEFPAQTYEMLLKSDPGIIYNLGKNLEVAYEIASMSPMDAALRIGQLTQGKPATIKTSAAPDPITPINSGSEPLADPWDNVASGCTFE